MRLCRRGTEENAWAGSGTGRSKGPSVAGRPAMWATAASPTEPEIAPCGGACTERERDVEVSKIVNYALACRRNDRTAEFPFRDKTTCALMPPTPQATPSPLSDRAYRSLR